MTRSYFLDQVNSWSELIDLCSDEGCDICSDIYSNDDIDSMIDDDVAEAIRSESWRYIRDNLADIDTDYDYYRCDGMFDYVGMDDTDFDTYKDDVLDWMDDCDRWEPEEDEEEEEEEYVEEEPQEAPPPQEDFSVGDLISMCLVDMANAKVAEKNRRASDEESIRKFLSVEEIDFLPF